MLFWNGSTMINQPDIVVQQPVAKQAKTNPLNLPVVNTDSVAQALATYRQTTPDQWSNAFTSRAIDDSGNLNSK
jgi:hypothetical protein